MLHPEFDFVVGAVITVVADVVAPIAVGVGFYERGAFAFARLVDRGGDLGMDVECVRAFGRYAWNP